MDVKRALLSPPFFPQTSYTSAGAVTAYHYGPSGNRVKKVTPSGGGTKTEIYVYDAFNKLAAEYSTVAPATPAGSYYRTVDHLGSTRLVTDGNQVAKQCYDYTPFGEEIPTTLGGRGSVACYAGTLDERHKFTGKERDSESKLDYFLARYYSGPMGRFLSVDPENAGASAKDPQTWNAYVYVNNRPLILTDPDGRCPNCVTGLAGFGVGFVVGAGTETFVQLKRKFDEGGRITLDGNKILAKGVKGGIVGGAVGLAGPAGFGLGLGPTTAVGAGASVAGGALERGIDSDPATEALAANEVQADVVSGGSAAFFPALTGKGFGSLPTVAAAREAAEQAGQAATQTTATVFPSFAQQAGQEAAKSTAGRVAAIEAIIRKLVSTPPKQVVNEEADKLREE